MPTIRNLREKQGLTRQDLSNKARVSISSIARLENGGVASRNTVLRLCDALGVGIEEVEGVNYQKIAAQG